MQPKEMAEQIFVFVIDETYGENEDDWEAESEKYRVELEAEFSTEFSEANIGPSVDIPAFLTVIATATVPLWTVLVGAFFLGKPINENLDGWLAIGKKLKVFFHRPVVLARHGASVLAVGAIFEYMGGMPKTVKLLSYRPMHIGDPDDLLIIPIGEGISENADTINLGFVRHIFEIEADGQMYRVAIDGTKTKILPLTA